MFRLLVCSYQSQNKQKLLTNPYSSLSPPSYTRNVYYYRKYFKWQSIISFGNYFKSFKYLIAVVWQIGKICLNCLDIRLIGSPFYFFQPIANYHGYLQWIGYSSTSLKENYPLCTEHVSSIKLLPTIVFLWGLC